MTKISLSFILYHLNVVIFLIFSIAFYTLMERKVLGLKQNRLGPNVLSFLGLLQPVSDALKLMNKMEFSLSNGNLLIYWFFPFLSFFMMLMLWSFYLLLAGSSEFNYNIFFLFLVLTITSYGLILTAWSSNSKYASMGGYRGMSQTISYEIILFLSFFIFFFFFKTYTFLYFFYFQSFIFMLPFFFIFFLSLVCEVNRAPFDLAEGESELVSGFNIEYGSLKFAVVFLTEYGMMIFMTFVFSVTFFLNFFLLVFFIVFFMFFFLWLRSSFPRLRFDHLMNLTWKILFNYLIFFSIFYFLIL